MATEYEIRPSARKWGVSDDDMLHALAHGVAVFEDQGTYGLDITVGWSTAGRLLEVGVIVRHATPSLVIHAMSCRPRFRRQTLNREDQP